MYIYIYIYIYTYTCTRICVRATRAHNSLLSRRPYVNSSPEEIDPHAHHRSLSLCKHVDS